MIGAGGISEVYRARDSIAEKLKVALAGDGDGPRAKRGADDLDAHNLYLRGRHLLNQRGDGVQRGLECFERAKALDPEFALAYSGLPKRTRSSVSTDSSASPR